MLMSMDFISFSTPSARLVSYDELGGNPHMTVAVSIADAAEIAEELGMDGWAMYQAKTDPITFESLISFFLMSEG